MKLILTLSTLVVFISIQSQITFKPGVRLGLNLADISNLNTKKSTNYYVGASFAVGFSKKYTLQPELTYSKQGAILLEADSGIYINDNSLEIEVDFISFTINNKFNINKNIHLLFGPFLDFRTNHNFDHFNSSFSFLIPDTDYGFIGGIGYNILNNFSVELRYKQGLYDIIKQINRDGERPKSNNKTQTIQLGLTYKFDFGK